MFTEKSSEPSEDEQMSLFTRRLQLYDIPVYEQIPTPLAEGVAVIQVTGKDCKLYVGGKSYPMKITEKEGDYTVSFSDPLPPGFKSSCSLWQFTRMYTWHGSKKALFPRLLEASQKHTAWAPYENYYAVKDLAPGKFVTVKSESTYDISIVWKNPDDKIDVYMYTINKDDQVVLKNTKTETEMSPEEVKKRYGQA